jgi:hypothetical protein
MRAGYPNIRHAVGIFVARLSHQSAPVSINDGKQICTTPTPSK